MCSYLQSGPRNLVAVEVTITWSPAVVLRSEVLNFGKVLLYGKYTYIKLYILSGIEMRTGVIHWYIQYEYFASYEDEDDDDDDDDALWTGVVRT